MGVLRAGDARQPHPAGLVLYEGPSQIDRCPVVVIATGLRRPTANQKTGNMVQTWVLRPDVDPRTAIHTGEDQSICGNCPLRGTVARGPGCRTTNQNRACYVRVDQAPLAVYRAFNRGRYRRFDSGEDLALFRGRMLRLGSYGDPCVVPYCVWSELIEVAKGHTGYTHQWQHGAFWRYRRILMASVTNPSDAHAARARGWRTFRIALPGDRPIKGERPCPASAELGHRLTCERCGRCNGAGDMPHRPSVMIRAHGSKATLASCRRVVVSNSPSGQDTSFAAIA